jgi:inner membrane protein
MDNLTHSLVGALLGQMGLKKKTGLAMPTLIIAANLPDIDAFAVLLGGHTHLALRRGITHGPIAMVLLPILLWAIMLAWDKWRPSEKRLPVHKGWLLTLAFIGCLSHPLFDWFNSYGIRLLEPFSSRWFYGDTLFIIDIWIWAAAISGLWLSLRRERAGAPNFTRPAIAAVIAILVYINGNAIITRAAVAATVDAIKKSGDHVYVNQVVANPQPLTFWRRELLFGSKNQYFRSEFSLFDARPVEINDDLLVVGKDAPQVTDIEKLMPKHPDLAAFLFWSRMPYDGVVEKNGKRTAIVRDARFSNPLVADRFTVKFPLEGYESMQDPSTLGTCREPCED